MRVELIAAVSRQKNGDLGISHKSSIPWYLPEDLKHFKDITMGSTVIMGRNTFESLPRPLRGRRNVVLTKNPTLEFEGAESICSFEAIALLVKQHAPEEKVFIIGGAALYQRFIDVADKIYLTEVQNYFECDNVIKGGVPNCYSLTDFSEVKKRGIVRYRFLEYSRPVSKDTNEEKYLGLTKEILEFGVPKHDRTGTGTISRCGAQLRFDISNGKIPMLTTKRVPFSVVIEELLWFCRGDTDNQILQEKGIKIWDGNSSREFLDSRGLYDYPDGCIGPGYGFQWRRFGAKYKPEYADSSKCLFGEIGGVDQLANVEHLLKTDPFSRRIMINAWNPSVLDKMALPPCHFVVMFYVEEIEGIKYLSCHFVMRSNDILLGLPLNLVSYSVLTQILALKCGMKAKELIYSCTDTHIYSNHLDQVKRQLLRTPRAAPLLQIDSSIKDKDWSEMSLKDFDLVGYLPAQGILAPMAV